VKRDKTTEHRQINIIACVLSI